MPEEIINLAPPLDAAQLALNAKFQDEMRNRYALPASSQDRDYYKRRLIADLLDILRVLQSQFEQSKDQVERATLANKSRQLKLDCSQWMIACGMFAEAVAICPDETERKRCQSYLDAENADDNHWCAHQRYILGADEKPQPNYYRELEYFSPKRGKMTSMLRCSECETRNAVDAPKDLLDLDELRRKTVEIHLAKNPS